MNQTGEVATYIQEALDFIDDEEIECIDNEGTTQTRLARIKQMNDSLNLSGCFYEDSISEARPKNGQMNVNNFVEDQEENKIGETEGSNLLLSVEDHEEA